MTEAEQRAWEQAQREGREWRGEAARKARAYDWNRARDRMPKADAPVMNGCIHHWRIAEPDGNRVITGECKKCGASRGFFAGEQDWEKARITDGLADKGDPRWREERAGYGW